jgi:hypothetical protein
MQFFCWRPISDLGLLSLNHPIRSRQHVRWNLPILDLRFWILDWDIIASDTRSALAKTLAGMVNPICMAV